MEDNLKFNINFTINDGKVTASIDKISAGFVKVQSATIKVNKAFASTVNSINSKIKSINLSSILDQVDRVSSGLTALSSNGLEYSSGLAELSALTGVTGKNLDKLGAKARASAKEFGGSATDSLNNYKTILSRFGPDIAKDQGALSAMEKYVRILSKTMGGDAAGAVDALTTGILQFGVDLSNPKTAAQEMSRMMNVMAAGAQEGAAEVPQISAALKVAGVQAKLSKVSFEETNSAIQALAAGGKEGAEAGVALRNVLGKMAGEDIIPKEAAGKLKSLGVDMSIVSDTSIPLTSRLRELRKAQGDATVMAQVFGTENAAAANILLSSIDAQDELTKKITGTQSAQEQANIVMESSAEKQARLKAKIDDLKISLFNGSNGWIGYASVLGDNVRDVSNIIPLFSAMGSVISFVTSKEKLQSVWSAITTAGAYAKAIAIGVLNGALWLWNAAQWALNAALYASPITWIIIGIMALIAVIVLIATKIQGWGNLWRHTVNFMKLSFQLFVETGKFAFLTMVDAIMIGIDKVKRGWYEFKNSVGLGDEKENNAAIKAIDADTEKRKNAILDGAKKIKDLGISAAKEAVLAFNSLSVKTEAAKSGKKKTDKATGKSNLVDGIAESKISGVDRTGNGKGIGKSAPTVNGKKSNEAIATGGTKNTVVNLTFKNMIENFTVAGKNFKESVNEMQEQTEDALLRTLAMANVAAG